MGEIKGLHPKEMNPLIGKHVLTLVDSEVNSLEIEF
ncbi:MAG: hypothetical protein JKY48_13995 [Flavobacteriales bacterium]|nr:hypothetical protein [Flavobacteriales bacterium]